MINTKTKKELNKILAENNGEKMLVIIHPEIDLSVLDNPICNYLRDNDAFEIYVPSVEELQCLASMWGVAYDEPGFWNKNSAYVIPKSRYCRKT